MRNHVVFKFLAIVLCALCLMTALVSGLALVSLTAMNPSSSQRPLERFEEQTKENLQWDATSLTARYAASTAPNADERLTSVYYQYVDRCLAFREMNYEIRDSKGRSLERKENYSGEGEEYTITVPKGADTYPTVLEEPVVLPDWKETAEAKKLWGSQEPRENFFQELEDSYGYSVRDDLENGDTILGFRQNDICYLYKIREVSLKENYTVVFRVSLESDSGYSTERRLWEFEDIIWRHQTLFAVALGISLALFAVLAVYLCMAAGHKPGTDEIRPGGLNCLPLEFYLAGVFGVVCLYCMGVAEGSEYLLSQSNTILFAYFGYGAYLCCLAFVGFCFACAAQFKAPNFYWWRHSVTGLCWRIVVWCWRFFWKCLGWAYRILWSAAIAVLLWMKKVLKKIGRFLAKAYRLLPLTWQWLLGGLLVGGCTFPGLITDSSLLLVVSFAIAIAVVIYGANAFGTLLEAAKRMRSGDLDVKVDDRLMLGSFQDLAEELNGLNGVVQLAAQKQMKSERMRTELITNVTHDIKTPLTSIINYVDLLQKPHTEDEEASYLEVLSRQSGRMKKLIDDLIELSKASTGNIPVDLARIDAVEAVNQALGEFTDKLTAAELIPMFRPPEETLYIRADGRLVWRAMSNLLSNAVKYAQPGTRLYIDMVALDGKVCISFKNISRAPLNVSADELMERFVRGEASRNQEGSGLGLNIAKSVMELQHGTLELLVDGDLFKATLIFPQEA